MTFDPNKYVKREDILRKYPSSLVVLTNFKSTSKGILDGGRIRDLGNIQDEMELINKWEDSGEDFIIVSTFIGFVPRAY